MTERKYPPLHPQNLEPHYSSHVAAMTTEELHSKADIAMQLAWRDQQLADRDATISSQLSTIERMAAKLTIALDERDAARAALERIRARVRGFLRVYHGADGGDTDEAINGAVDALAAELDK
jgi:hypothetical protein